MINEERETERGEYAPIRVCGTKKFCEKMSVQGNACRIKKDFLESKKNKELKGSSKKILFSNCYNTVLRKLNQKKMPLKPTRRQSASQPSLTLQF